MSNIGEYAFCNCRGIENIVLPDGITQINPYTFHNCDNLRSVIVPDTVTCICEHAFSSSGVNSVVVSDSLTSIGDYAFGSCIYLNNLPIPNGLIHLGEGAFFECPEIYNEYEGSYYIGNEKNKYIILVDVIDSNLKNYVVHQNTRIIYLFFSFPM